MQRWIHDIRFSYKLATIIVAALVPISLLTVFFLRSEQQRIGAARLELAGLAAYRPLEGMLAPLADMQLWAVAQAAGDPAARDKLQAARAQVERQMAQRVATTVDYGAPQGEDARRWSEIQTAWTSLANTRFTDIAEANKRYVAFRGMIQSLRDYVTSTSGLVLDPDPVSYFVIVGATQAVPDFEVNIGEMRTSAAAIGASGSASAEQISEVVRSQVLSQKAVEDIKLALEHAAGSGARGQRIKAAMAEQVGAVEKNLADFTRFVRSEVTNSTISAPLDDVLAKSDGIMSAAVQLHGLMVEATQRQLEASVAATARTRNAMLVLVLLTLGVSVAVTLLVARSTVAGLNDAVGAVQRLAEGDYTSHVEVRGRDELARMMLALQQMQDKVASVLGGVKNSAATVAAAAREINAGTVDLSRRTEQQAASLEETASSMEEMTATVKQNADNARLANQLAQAARDQAEHGGSVVEQAVAAMSAIDGSSKKIADIISVIDEIAFQTNLLALNAAVEAARAGDQGRGFAVVASEVRSLAQRSASAAREIKNLIHDSVGKVEEGGRLVSESGRHLAEIVASVKKVSDVVGEISNASQEQAVSAEEIGRAVMQMDEGTQQNAAMVEQASAAAASMNEEAGKLSQLTSFFKLHTAAVAPAVREAAAVTAPAAAPAAAGKAAAPAATQAPPTRERRGASRPWTRRPAAGAAAMPGPARRAASDAAREGDWSEF
jgi:methyl-accepting chemotaxis protein